MLEKPPPDYVLTYTHSHSSVDMFEMLAALAASRSQSQPGEKRAPVIEPLSLEGIVKKISEFRNLDKSEVVCTCMSGCGAGVLAWCVI